MRTRTIRDVLEQVQQDVAMNLNPFIESSQRDGESWFQELSFHDDAPRTEGDSHFMGIYLSSPDGEVYASSSGAKVVMVTLDCTLDRIRENANRAEKYLSAVVDYLSKRIYGVTSEVTTGVVVRTDLGAPVNGFAVAVSVTLHRTDFDI